MNAFQNKAVLKTALVIPAGGWEWGRDLHQVGVIPSGRDSRPPTHPPAGMTDCGTRRSGES